MTTISRTPQNSQPAYVNYRVSPDKRVSLISHSPLSIKELEALVKCLQLEHDMLEEDEAKEATDDHWLLGLAMQQADASHTGAEGSGGE